MATGYTTTTSLAYIIPEITERVQYIFQNAGIGRQLVTYRDITGQPGVTVEFPIFSEVAASTSVGETATPDSHAMAVTSGTLTIAKRSVYVGVGDLAKKAMADPVAAISDAMGKAMVKAIDASIFNVISTTNYATSAGATNAALTLANCLSALNILEENEADLPYAVVLHPHQYKSIRTTLVATEATTGTASLKVANIKTNEQLQAAYVSSMFGMNWFVTNRVSSRTVDATANCWSGLVFHQRGIGYGFSWLAEQGIEVIRSLSAVDETILNWADSAAVIYASGVCTLYSTSA